MIEKFLFLGLTSFIVFSFPFFRKIYFSEKLSIKQTEKKKERYDFFDLLRGLAILAVIMIHIGDSFILDSAGKKQFLYIVNNISRFAVPFFIISSGILLTRYSNLSKFYSRKIIRNFFPYFLVSFLVGLYYRDGLGEILHSFVSGSASLPYYFMAALLQFYIIYPFLERLSDKKYFLHISFLITVYTFFDFRFWSVFGIPLAFKYLFLFSYGIAMKNRFLSDEFVFRKTEKYFWMLLIIYYLFFTTYLESYFYNTRLFFAVALFNILFYYKDEIKKLSFYQSLVFLGKNSLWIYLIHYFIVSYVYIFVASTSLAFGWQYILMIVTTVPGSIVFSLGFKKIYLNIFNLIKIKAVK